MKTDVQQAQHQQQSQASVLEKSWQCDAGAGPQMYCNRCNAMQCSSMQSLVSVQLIYTCSGRTARLCSQPLLSKKKKKWQRMNVKFASGLSTITDIAEHELFSMLDCRVDDCWTTEA